MKDKTTASLEALTGLLGERQRYEEWLAALESRKSSTPDSVYQKVRTDYESRLKDVSDRLGARAGELKSHIDALTAKLQGISQEEAAQHESRQEAEVRAAVGEYTDEEWQRIKADSERELSRIAVDRTAAETQLAELNRVFTLSANPSVPGTLSAAPTAPKAHAVATASTSAPTPTPTPAPAPTQAKPVSTAPEQNGQRRTASSGWPQRDGETAAQAISVAPGKSEPEAAKAGPGITREQPAAGVGSPASDRGTGLEEAASPTTATKSKRSGLPDLRTEQQKTLKCPECGASNYPTEWYCERCGGELATL
ncbi:MAG: hypothetical protein M3Z17_08065 [Gemmatimonadota bacterium]|nr:hypothetical protein [Gemmatimonadota bacterium]